MKYNLAIASEADKAFEYLTELVGKHAMAEVIKISPKRSLPQNNYLHLLLSAFGLHFGYTLEEAKLIYKEINRDLYFYKKTVRGKTREFIRSSADLSVEDMAKSIDVLHKKSAEAGYPLPLATDDAWLMSLENAIEQHKHYL